MESDDIPHTNTLFHSTKKHRDGIGLNSSFKYPGQMMMDSNGFIYLVDDSTVRRIDPEFDVKTIARIEGKFQKERNKSSLHFDFDSREKTGSNLTGIALDEENRMIYVSDFSRNVIWSLPISGNDPKILTGQRGMNSNFRSSSFLFF